MDTTANLNLARHEYTERLKEIIQKDIFLKIKDIWDEDKNLTNFQINLCKIPRWNQEIINTFYDSLLINEGITKEFLDNIIEAVFVSNIKILSAVKLQDKKKVVNVPIPDTKNFFHKIIIEVARNLYADPYLIETRTKFIKSSEINRNTKKIYKIIDDSVDKTIRLLLPMEEILTVYLEPEAEPEIEAEDEIEPVVEQIREPVPELVSEQVVEHQPTNYEPQNVFNNTPAPAPIEELFNKEPINTSSGFRDELFNTEPEYREPVEPVTSPKQDDPIKVNLKSEDKQNFFSDDEAESVTEI